MPESTTQSSPPPPTKKISWPYLTLLLTLIFPILLASLVYELDSFDPAPLPTAELTQKPVIIPRKNMNMLQGSEKIGAGELLAPEDIAFDAKLGVIYTGCADGWIKRVTLVDSVVENWVNTGGRPLGVTLGLSGDIIVADPDKGLLKISKDGEITLLTDEAEGVKFKLTDAAVVAKNGIIYFTDASHKYSFHEHIWDILEGRPNGRLLSYDPSTKQTKVLIRDLYFANGIELSPDEEFIIFCETPLLRCRKYFLQGEREGTIDRFVDHLFGAPDNIHYDGQGHYWIGMAMELTYAWELTLKYPFIRKVFAIMEKYWGRPQMEKNGGVISVDLEGKPVELYVDQKLALVSTGIKIGEHLYVGSLSKQYIIRLNLTEYPAVVSS